MKNSYKQVNKTAVAVKIVLSVFTLLVCAASAASMLWYDRTITEPTTQRMKELIGEAAPYEEEYARVVQQLSFAKDDYDAAKLLGKKKTLLIFDQCYDNLYKTVYPICQKRKVAGVFTLSGECMVGEEGCITVEQYKELLENGWQAAIRSPAGNKDHDRYVAEIKEKLEALGLEMPTICYVSRGAFDPARYEKIRNDFSMMLYYLDDDLSAVDFGTMTEKDDFMAVPYLYTSRKTQIQSRYLAYMADGQDCCICLGKISSNSTLIETSRLEKDNTVINLEDIVETIAVRTRYYKNPEDYRKEEFNVNTKYAQKADECLAKVTELKNEKQSLFEEIIAIYNGT